MDSGFGYELVECIVLCQSRFVEPILHLEIGLSSVWIKCVCLLHHLLERMNNYSFISLDLFGGELVLQ